MKKSNLINILILACSFLNIQAQHLPKNNSALNYTNIYLEEAIVKSAINYELVLSRDSLFSAQSTIKINAKIPAFWVNNVGWTCRYFWQVNAYDANHKLVRTSDKHFFTTITPGVFAFDSLKIQVQKNKVTKTAEGFICIDHARSIINREGKIVWSVPEIPNLLNINSLTKDLKVTEQNSVTFMTDSVPLEISLSGNVLWKGPNNFVFKGDTISFHHDFKKTSDSSYMILGNRYVYRRVLNNFSDSILKAEPKAKVINGELHKRVEVSIIMEFNSKNELVWYWDANDYLKDEDLNYKKQANGFPNLSSHMNAFSVSKDGAKVYAGFRDLNRIIKIDKKTMAVEMSYGEKFPSGDGKVAHNLFRAQHDAFITNRNSLLIINNNEPNAANTSSIVEIKENCIHPDSCLVWNFDFNFDKLTNGKSVKAGNAVFLPNGNYFVCEGLLNRIFEVTAKKEIVWDAFIFSKLKNDKNWRPCPQYRCNWIKQLNYYHFLAQQQTEAKIENAKIKLDIAIHNTGTDDDVYRVEVCTKNNNTPFYTIETKNVETNSLYLQSLDIPIIRKIVGEFKIIVSSKKDNAMRKTLVVTIK